jgi:hypothetical protein
MKTIFKPGIFALAISFLFSCKKMQDKPHELSQSPEMTATKKVVETVKGWMDAQPPNARTFTAMVDGKQLKLDKDFKWEETQYFPEEKIAVTPVLIKGVKAEHAFKYLAVKLTADQAVEHGYYFDVYGKQAGQINGNHFLLNLVQNRKAPESFTGAFIKYDLYDKPEGSGHFENGRLTEKSSKLVLKKAKKTVTEGSGDIMSAPLDEGCEYVMIDWFWQVYVGGLLVAEEYLFSSEVIVCENGGGGGGGVGENPYAACNAQFNALINGGEPTSTLVSTTANYIQPAERQYTYKWKALKGIGFSVYSYDVGTHIKTTDPKMPWKWKSIVHGSLQIQGLGIGGIVDKVGDGTMSVTLGNINANVSLDFTLKYTPNCGISGAPSLNPYTVSYHAQIIFSVYPYPGGPNPTLQ